MVCSADELVVWRDFPKGLRVLLLDEDCNSAEESRLKLEAMDYIVFSFQNEKDALEAVLKKADSFHVAIVEMTTKNSSGSFRFLELAKDLPTVVISDVRSLSTMMKCIALGAAEFLEKPLSEDKLRNIWQHVVHKAFNAGADILSESLKPVKETVSSILQLQPETSELGSEVLSEVIHEVNDMDNDNQNSGAGEKFSAPSTPQLEPGERLLDGGDYHDQANCSHETETETESKANCIDLVKQREDNSSESKSVENTCISLTNLDDKKDVSISIVEELVCDEVDSANGSKMDVESLRQGSNNKKMVSYMNSRSHCKRGNRKRMKVDWTADLHRRFVQAVEQLGIDQAIPSKILELMNVEGLTRHNVASHLQKFRMQRRHILPKDDHRRWKPHREHLPRNYMPKPPVFPPFHSNYGFPPQHVYPVWGHPSYLQSAFPMWGNAGILPWQPPPQNWPQKTYSGVHADAWGCPTVPPYSQYNFSSHIQSSSNGLDVRERSKGLKDPYDVNQVHAEAWGCPTVPPYNQYNFSSHSSSNGLDARERSKGSKDSYDVNQQAEEMVDQVLAEAISKTWLPLPLGLELPSVDSVLTEFHRQGRASAPSHQLSVGDQLWTST